METYDYDPRFSRLPMGSSPVPTVLIILVYLVVVKILGPAWMKNRKPYNLRGLLILYNFGMVIANGWMFYKSLRHWIWRYRWTCANIDYLETEDSLEAVKLVWVFFITKFFELADTVFFVLRKKDSQISFLHVVHHSLVPLITWYLGHLGASGYNTLFGFINMFVHIWMYLYYGLAAFGPSIQKYLWWKKYLTKLQIMQFCLMTVATISVMVTPDCQVPRKIIAMNLLTALFFLILFANFYISSYKTQRKTKSSENSHKPFPINGEDSNGDLNGKLNNENGKRNNKLSHNE